MACKRAHAVCMHECATNIEEALTGPCVPGTQTSQLHEAVIAMAFQLVQDLYHVVRQRMMMCLVRKYIALRNLPHSASTHGRPLLAYVPTVSASFKRNQYEEQNEV